MTSTPAEPLPRHKRSSRYWSAGPCSRRGGSSTRPCCSPRESGDCFRSSPSCRVRSRTRRRAQARKRIRLCRSVERDPPRPPRGDGVGARQAQRRGDLAGRLRIRYCGISCMMAGRATSATRPTMATTVSSSVNEYPREAASLLFTASPSPKRLTTRESPEWSAEPTAMKDTRRGRHGSPFQDRSPGSRC